MLWAEAGFVRRKRKGGWANAAKGLYNRGDEAGGRLMDDFWRELARADELLGLKYVAKGQPMLPFGGGERAPTQKEQRTQQTPERAAAPPGRRPDNADCLLYTSPSPRDRG